MTTRSNPADEIIELTEIVTEDSPLDEPAPEPASPPKLDQTTLDQELDDLLREAPGPSAGMDLDALLGPQTTTSSTAGSTRSETRGMEVSTLDSDLADLEDLFETLKTTPPQDAPTALDELLDIELDTPQATRTTPPTAEAQPGLHFDSEQPAQSVRPGHVDSTEELIVELTDIVAEAPLNSPAEPRATHDVSAQDDSSPIIPPVEDDSRSSGAAMDAGALQKLATRLDELETRVATPVPPSTEQILAALPAELERLPFALPLYESILAEVDTKLASQGDQTGSSLQQELVAMNERLTALEARPEPEPLSAEHILAVLPEDPAAIPALAGLAQSLRGDLDARLAGLDHAGTLETLRQDLTAASERLTALEARPEPEPLSAEHILAVLPEDPAAIPALAGLAQSLRGDLDARLAGLDHAGTLESLRQDLAAASERVAALEARPEPKPLSAEHILAALPEDPAAIPALAGLAQSLRDDLGARLAGMDHA
ncbi:MAG: hypothetical protein EOL86_04470, partial [Deltaproteobacteria bacterium]|nr:hypothetical protein [Deltaproteobacteria bacterium]